MRDRLLELLADGPMTVPELAAAARLPAAEVMVWVMGLRKYGHVVEREGQRSGGRVPIRGGEASHERRSSAPSLDGGATRARRPSTPQACMNCGFCTAACPLDLDVLPRRLFRHVLFGMDRRGSRPEAEHGVLVPAVPGLRAELPGRGPHHRERAPAAAVAARRGL